MKITEFLAIYGAVVSTAVFAWNVTASRAKIAVTLTGGIDQSGEELQSGVYLSIQNPSPHTVHVNSVSLVYPYRKVTLLEKIAHLFRYRRLDRYIDWVHNGLVFDGIETGLPVSIEPRQSHSIFIPENVIWEMLNKEGATVFAAVAQDALWRNKYSGVFEMYRSKGDI